MDIKDKKIAAELALNSRIPITQLAKKARVSREVASYRIKKLQSSLFREFNTIINVEALGYRRFGCFLQLKNISAEEEKRFFDYLKDHDYISAISPVVGRWNVVFDIFARDDNHLSNIIKEISKEFSSKLEDYILIGNSIETFFFPAKYFSSTMELKTKPISKKYKIDKKDLRILEAISNNSRIEYKELAKKTNMTGNGIKYRIKSLERNGIIMGYSVSINPEVLGYNIYNLQLKINNFDNNSQLTNFLKRNSRVFYYYLYATRSNWNCDVGIIAKNSKDLRNLIIELRKEFGDILKIYDIYVIIDILKEKIPQGVFE